MRLPAAITEEEAIRCGVVLQDSTGSHFCEFHVATLQRFADSVADNAEAEEFRAFLDAHEVADEDRVIRRIALRGFAEDGLALARADLVPEITITIDGVFWHPVGAEDFDLLVLREIFPLAELFSAVRRAFEHETAL